LSQEAEAFQEAEARGAFHRAPPPFKETNMSNEENAAVSQISLEIAAATRVLEQRGVLNYSGHMSSRIPGTDNILIQRRSDSRASLQPDRMVQVALDGRTLSEEGKPPSETVIHLEILKARPDVNCVLHCHMPGAVKFTLMRGAKLEPLLSHATRWRDGVPIHPDPGHIETPEQGRALAQTLAGHNGALMRAHGMVLVAESIPGLFVDAIHFQENAEAYMDVLRAGQEPYPLSREQLDELLRHERRGHHIRKIWDHYMTKATEAGVVPADWNLAPSLEKAGAPSA
jgi:L-ribulose-5-phosphate 4-epimerase